MEEGAASPRIPALGPLPVPAATSGKPASTRISCPPRRWLCPRGAPAGRCWAVGRAWRTGPLAGLNFVQTLPRSTVWRTTRTQALVFSSCISRPIRRPRRNMATSFVNSDPFEPQVTIAKDYQDLQSLDVVDENQRRLGRVLSSSQPPWRRICPTSRLLLVLTAFCGILTLSVVIIGIKRTQLSTDQQGTWETLRSVNLTLSTWLGRHQRKENTTSSKLATLEKLLSEQNNDMGKVETRLKNLLGSLEKDTKTFRCNIAEMKSNGSKTGCCPKNWVVFHNSCYWTTRQRLPWEAAKQDCERKSAHLVIINSPNEQAFVMRHKRSSDMWIGLTDVSGNWKWVDGSSYELRPQDWAEGQPDHWYGHGLGGGEDCVHISPLDGWNDNHCSRPYPWMCEVELQA